MGITDDLKAVKVRAVEAARALISLDAAISNMICEAPEEDMDAAFTSQNCIDFLVLLAKSALNEGVSAADAFGGIGIAHARGHALTRRVRGMLRASSLEPTDVFWNHMRTVDGVTMTWFYAGPKLSAGIEAIKATNVGS